MSNHLYEYFPNHIDTCKTGELTFFMIIQMWKTWSKSFVHNICHPLVLIKSPPVYWGWLYVFVPVRTPPPAPPPPAADSCSRDNFWTTFWISFIFGTIVGPDLQITWLHFRRFSSWPWPRFFKVKYGICYISAKNGPIATKRKANIAIELWGSNVTSGFDLGHDLDLEFSRSNIEFAISQPKMVRLPRNEKQT